MNSIIKFDNVLNVRDFGGQILASNKRVVKDTLYRGAQLSRMSKEDRKKLIKFGISLLIDMRYHPERKRQATVFGQKFDPDVFEILEEHDLESGEQLAPHEAFVLYELASAGDAKRYMMGSYKERPLSEAFISIASKSLKRMAQQKDTVYVHCAAGKDRTGTFAAVVLMLLGATDDDVMHDYMLTSQAVDLDLILELAAKRMEMRYGRTYAPEAIRPFFGVEPDYLTQSLASIGDITSYVKNVLGLTEQEIANVQANYIAT